MSNHTAVPGAQSGGGGLVRQQPPLADERDARHETVRQIEVMRGDDHDRPRGRQLAQPIRDDADGVIVEAGERFVEQHEPWRMQQGTFEREALAHAAREPRDLLMPAVGQPRAVERGVNAGAVLDAVQPGEEVEVLPGRQFGIQMQFVRQQTDLKLGIEADFVPGREDRIANVLDARAWDYVIGSVHFIREGAIDMAVWDAWDDADADAVWTRYFELLAEAARSGLYDVLAHPDLVKIWGDQRPAPPRELRHYYEPALEAIAETGIAVEVSTAGLRKPAGEIYPSPDFLSGVLEAGAPISLSSDAHLPDQLGFRYDEALSLLADNGVAQICRFSGRERELVEVG